MIPLLFSLALASTPPTNYLELKKTANSETAEMKVRWKSIVEMSKTQHPDREKDLIKGLKDSTWYIRNVSLLALESINPLRGREEALKLLSDPSLVVRSAAVEVLKKSSQETVVRKNLWSQMKNKQNRSQGHSLWIRSQMMQILAEKPLASERAQFLSFLEDSDPEVRNLARSVATQNK